MSHTPNHESTPASSSVVEAGEQSEPSFRDQVVQQFNAVDDVARRLGFDDDWLEPDENGMTYIDGAAELVALTNKLVDNPNEAPKDYERMFLDFMRTEQARLSARASVDQIKLKKHINEGRGKDEQLEDYDSVLHAAFQKKAADLESQGLHDADTQDEAKDVRRQARDCLGAAYSIENGRGILVGDFLEEARGIEAGEYSDDRLRPAVISLKARMEANLQEERAYMLLARDFPDKDSIRTAEPTGETKDVPQDAAPAKRRPGAIGSVPVSFGTVMPEAAENPASPDGSAVPAEPELKPNTSRAPEESPEAITARELLSNSALFRAEVIDVASSAVSRVHMRVAKIRNGISTPRNVYLEWRRNAAEAKYNRKAAKQGMSMFQFINKHHDRVAAQAKAMLDRREQKYSKHSREMDNRIATAHQRTGERRALADNLRNKLAEDKIRAEERRIMRRERAVRRARVASMDRKASRQDRQKLINTFTAQDRQRIRNAAIRAIKQRRQQS